MISVDFAPNEKKRDAWIALKIIFQPWRWRQGREVSKLKNLLKKKYFPNSSKPSNIHLFYSGRSALYYLLKTFNLDQNTAVMIQAFTCEAVVLPILAHNFNPVYVDINKKDYSMHLEDLKKKYTPEVRIIILQHTFGITPQHREEIINFAKKKNIILIEDLAHGFDSTLYYNKYFNSHLLLSFGRSKAFSSVFGGAIVTRDKKISQGLHELEKTVAYPSHLTILRLLWYKIMSVLIKSTYNSFYFGKSIHFITNKLNLLESEISKKEKRGKYDYKYSKAYPNAAAILMLEQLKTFNDVVKRRIKSVAYYQSRLNTTNTYSEALIRYPYVTPLRNKIISHAQKKNVFLGKWYDQVVAPSSLDLKKVKYKHGSCPKAEEATEQVLNLPTNITRLEAEKIVKIIEDIEKNI